MYASSFAAVPQNWRATCEHMTGCNSGETMMYQAYQAHSDLMWPLRALSRLSLPLLQDPGNTLSAWPASRHMAAACKVLELSAVRHARPAWRIDSIEVKGQAHPVQEEVVISTPFATLLRFRKQGVENQPKLLVVAPMSGHFATLLRDTVRTTLQDHDVYVTDWHNVRDVPLEAGVFGLDEYTAHIIDGAGRQFAGSLPALRGGTRCGRADERGRSSRHAPEPDPDGRAH